jgi:CubicO group peptidase (beta-lactamase class C family)
MREMKPPAAIPRVRAAVHVGLACLVVVGAVGSAHSQSPPAGTPTAAQVDRIFARVDKTDSPGCALAVIRNGSIVYARGYGMADLDHNIRITPSTVFHAASLAKQFTAMAIMLLVKQGRLALDDDVRTHVPELPDLGARVTIGHLLHHTSGLRDQWVLVTMAGWRLSDDVVTRQDVLGLVSRMHALNFRPGDQYLYTNTGFTLAAAIVEKVSRQSLQDFAQANIFQPLGMSRTVFRETHGLVVRDHAYGYRAVGSGPRFEVRMPNYDLVGPTNLLTTVEDLARWDRNFDDKTVGGGAVLALMQTPGTLNNGDSIPYGLGLMPGEYRGLRVVEHDGRDAGYRSHLIRFPSLRFSVACLCNLALPDDALPRDLVRRVADLYLAAQFPPALPGMDPPGNAFPPPTRQERAAKVGAYWNPLTETLAQVSVARGALQLCLASDCAPLGSLDQNRFRWDGGPQLGVVEFAPPAGGAAGRLTFRGEGQRVMTFDAKPPAATPPANLAEYAGRYYSPELDTAYDISLRTPSLLITRQKYPATVLEPAFRDGFTISNFSVVLPFGTVSFTRDAQGRITGFLIGGDRIRSFRFDRVRPGS